MFEKFFEFIVQCWERLSPFEVIDAYQAGGVLRFGKYHRTLVPGLHMKWPIAERVVVVETCITTLRLPPQTLTTKDDVSVVVQAMIKYQILVDKLEAYITEIWDQTDVLADVAMGAIRTEVGKLNYAELVTEKPEQKVVEAARNEVNRYGFKLHRITFTDLGRMRSLRLITRTPTKVAN